MPLNFLWTLQLAVDLESELYGTHKAQSRARAFIVQLVSVACSEAKQLQAWRLWDGPLGPPDY